MGEKTGNHDWDDFRQEQESLERDVDQLDEQITIVLDDIKKGDES